MKKKIIATEVCTGCFDSRLDFREGLETWVVGKWLEIEPLGIRACLNCGFIQCSKCHIDMETQMGEEGQFFYCPGCDLRIRIEWPTCFKRSNTKSKAYWDADYLEKKRK